MQKKIIITLIILIVLGIIIYLNPIMLYKNNKLKNYIDSISNQSSISTKELIPFDYDKLHIIYPYTSKEDIEKQIGIKSRFIRENQNDNYQTLIVVKDNKIVSVTNISLYYNFQPLQGYNYIVNKKDSKILIHKHNSGYSFIEQYNEIEESYYDIKYKLPGSFNEEDDESPGNFYYLDIDNDEYLLVLKENNFNYKKYISNKDIISSKEELINNYKSYYLESKELNTIDIIYIIEVNKTNYIFRLNSKKENLVKNKETLYNIIQSVKE